MEEQPKSEKKPSKKKPSVTDQAKITAAKKKVNEILQGTGLEDPEDVFVPPTEDNSPMNIALDNNATSWLNDQVAGLTQQAEEYEKIIAQLRAENTNLLTTLKVGGGEVSASEKNKIIELYKYFEGIYTGRNPMRTAFDTAKFSNPSHGTGILDMFLSTFVFLHDYKQYQHRG